MTDESPDTKHKERARRHQEQADVSFERWKNDQQTKLLLSMVPPPEPPAPPELLATLLRGAFDAGVGTGMLNAMGDIVGIVMTARDRS